METQVGWRTYVMVACGLIAVLLDALPPQMLVPITPSWLGWCGDKITTFTLNVTDEVTTIASIDATTETTTTQFITMPSESWTLRTDEVANLSLKMVTQYETNDTQVVEVITNASLNDNKSCTKKDFDPRISLVYLAAGPVEVLCSPLVAMMCDRVGSSALLLLGLISTAIIDIPFAYGSGFLAYLLLRIVINIATTITEVSYLHMIGQLFAGDDIKRARFLGLYSTVLGLDYFGPTFSGVLYHISGQAVPFLSLLAIGLVTALVFFIFGLNCKISKNTNLDDKLDKVKPADIPYKSLIKDPYIIVVFLSVFLTILPKAMVAPFISLWLMDTFDASDWVTGVVYFPGFIAYILSTIVAERLVSKCKENAWAFGAACLTLDGICVIGLPFSPNIICFSAIFALQITTATIAAFTIFPMFLRIADKRYGCPKSSSVHGFSFMAVGLAYFLGPMFASELFKQIGFRFINLGVGSLHLLVAPFIIILRNLNDKTKEVNEETYLVTSAESINEMQSYD